MKKYLGLDIGTNSIGWAIRNTILPDNQIEKYGVIVFKKGVGEGKSGEFSLAAERTKNRSRRRLYQSRKYRLWATLEVLIKNKMCPLTINELDLWRKHKKGQTRTYPIIEKFENWIKLDFNNDNIPDYKSPYQLRKKLTEVQLNLESEADRFKLGRALYHIAQRRGFKSSKGETAKEREEAENNEFALENENDTQDENFTSLKKSEQKKAGKIYEYIEKRKAEGANSQTIGCAFADLENTGERIRENWLQATIRQQYEDEIKYIFNFQENLSIQNEFYKAIHKAIFYKRPLRSQKGLVGKCTLEPSKPRCPISHPDYEEFRAWSFINTIRYKKTNTGQNENWEELTLDIRNKLYNKLFMRTKANFTFEEIANFLIKETSSILDFKYKKKTNVSGCPVSARLKNLFGENWKEFLKTTIKERTDKNGKTHTVNYTIEDIWHVLFSFEDEECVSEFARNELELDEKGIKDFINAWHAIAQGYSMLSLKAIRNINRFLKLGFIYTEAVLLAKLPEMLGDELWLKNEQLFTEEIGNLIQKNREEKKLLNIANNLIAKYKTLEIHEKFAYKNTSYTLDQAGWESIESTTKESFGEKTWSNLSEDEKQKITQQVGTCFQQFFSASKRDFFRLPRLGDTLKQFLSDNFNHLNCPNNFILIDNTSCNCEVCKKLNKIYHPSQISIYPPANETNIEWEGELLSLRLLESPKTGSFKNPMAMRTLHELRKLINYLIKTGQIDEETRVVVETARQLNDANMRWAIETYQRQREAENKEFETAIVELLNDPDFKGNANSANPDDIDKVRLLSEQFEVVESGIQQETLEETTNKKRKKVEYFNKSPEFLKKIIVEKDLVTKYRLWKEQEFRCIYTGKLIKITDLFAENIVDFEHTIPRSISFDNSLANLTVCYADFNRTVKRKQIPSQLNNHDEILGRLKSWKEKIERLEENIDFWKKKSKGAATKDYKDKAIRQRHLWQMELNYWKNKLGRFTMKEVNSGFKNSQLIDTQLISKYAYHYLKTVFNSVDVQKGSVTADFRKIYGIKPNDETKDSSRHSHHAKDAVVLTMIPAAAKREEILKKTYKDAEDRNSDRIKHTEPPYKGFKHEYIEAIDDNILINNIAKDQALTHGKKIVRKRGRIVYLRDKNGRLIYDENGKPKPKIAKGDCIRGQLHKETFFGAIKEPIRDEKTEKPIVENGCFVYEKDNDGNDKLLMVVKKLLKDFSSEKDINSIIDPRVKYSISTTIYERIKEGKTFKEAVSENIWLLDNNGNFIKKDKNGKPLNPIRHVRCKVAAGRGYMTKEKSLIVKQHTHLSKHYYKHYYYAQNADNYLYLLYEAKTEKGFKRAFRILNYLDIPKMEIKSLNDLLINPYFQYLEKSRGKTKTIFKLSNIIKSETKVLVKKSEDEAVQELSHSDLVKRLYKVCKFNDIGGTGFVYLQNHIEARPNKELENEDNVIDVSKYQHRLRLSSDNFNCLVEGYDFEIKPTGEIAFL